MVGEAIRADWKIEAILLQENKLEELKTIWEQLPAQNCYSVDAKNFKLISNFASSEGIIAILNFPSVDFGLAQDNVELSNGGGFILEDIQDPGNLGTILRIADWFGHEQVICNKGTVDFSNPKVLRSSMGSAFRVKVVYAHDLESVISKHIHQVLVADIQGPAPQAQSLSKDCHFLLGNEANGLSTKIRNIKGIKFVSIPKIGRAESLNVSIAAGILAWEHSRQTTEN